jgi:hypothetical protein
MLLWTIMSMQESGDKMGRKGKEKREGKRKPSLKIKYR